MYFQEHRFQPETETLLLFISTQCSLIYVVSTGFIGQRISLLFPGTDGSILPGSVYLTITVGEKKSSHMQILLRPKRIWSCWEPDLQRVPSRGIFMHCTPCGCAAEATHVIYMKIPLVLQFVHREMLLFLGFTFLLVACLLLFVVLKGLIQSCPQQLLGEYYRPLSYTSLLHRNDSNYNRILLPCCAKHSSPDVLQKKNKNPSLSLNHIWVKEKNEMLTSQKSTGAFPDPGCGFVKGPALASAGWQWLLWMVRPGLLVGTEYIFRLSAWSCSLCSPW